jgi:hypothetical protein
MEITVEKRITVGNLAQRASIDGTAWWLERFGHAGYRNVVMMTRQELWYADSLFGGAKLDTTDGNVFEAVIGGKRVSLIDGMRMSGSPANFLANATISSDYVWQHGAENVFAKIIFGLTGGAQ